MTNYLFFKKLMHFIDKKCSAKRDISLKFISEE